MLEKDPNLPPIKKTNDSRNRKCCTLSISKSAPWMSLRANLRRLGGRCLINCHGMTLNKRSCFKPPPKVMPLGFQSHSTLWHQHTRTEHS